MFWDWLIHSGIKIQIQLVTLLVFILLTHRLKGADLWIYAVIITYTIVDVSGAYLSHLKIVNHWLYNLALFPQFIMVCAAFHQHGKNRKLRYFFGAGCLLILAAHAVNTAFYQGTEHFANFTYIPASAWMAAYAFFFLRNKLESLDSSPFSELVDWFALATLIDNAGAIPIVSLLGWTDFINNENVGHLYQIVTWLFMIWYLLNLTGLLWTRTTLRSVLSSR